MTDVSTAILDTIHKAGARHVFGVPGDAINGLVDATRRHESVDFVTVRHEEAGAFAASAQAKLTGRLGVAVGTAGPGAIHLLNGLYDAKLDSAPVLAVTGQVGSGELGTSAQQEIDLLRLFDDVAVFNVAIVNPEQVPTVVRNAVREAMTNRAVAHLSIPEDMALAEVSIDSDTSLIPRSGTQKPDPDELARAGEVIDSGNAVTFLVGIGARESMDAVLLLAERTLAPIIKSLRAKEQLQDGHHLATGGLGLLGSTASVKAIERSDVLVMIGTDFPYRDFYPDGRARVVQIDIEASHIGRRTPVDVGVVGDAGHVVRALHDTVGQSTSSDHLDRAREDTREWNAEMAEAENDDVTPIRPQRLAASVGRHTRPGAIYICDTGAVTAWCARHLAMKEGDRFTLSSSLASMAYGLPGAIGAQLAYPESQVVALVGDGGFSMLLGDLLTAVSLNLPITVVVFNNQKLGLIQVEQEAEGLPEHAIDLFDPDYAAVGRAMGAEGRRVSKPDNLDAALSQAIGSDRPSVVDVVIDPEEITVPPEIEPSYFFGYAKAKIRELVGTGEGLAGVRSAIRQTAERITN